MTHLKLASSARTLTLVASLPLCYRCLSLPFSHCTLKITNDKMPPPPFGDRDTPSILPESGWTARLLSVFLLMMVWFSAPCVGHPSEAAAPRSRLHAIS